MERGNLPDLDDVATRRDYLFGAGSIAVLGGAAGCLGLDEDDQQSEESESEAGANDSADEDPDDALIEPDEVDATEDDYDVEEGDDSAETESEDEATAEEGIDDEDVDAEDDDSTLEEESGNDDSDDKSGDDGSGDQDGENNDEDESNETEEGDGDDGVKEGEDDETGDERTDDADENSEEDGKEEDGDEAGEDQEERDSSAARYTNDEYDYELEYPDQWVVEEGDDYVQILDGDETARIWVGFTETPLNLDQGVRNYRETFDPNPGVEVHEDDPITLSSGEEGHRFVIEITEERNQIFAHELIAHVNGIQYLTSVIISRSEYNENYAQLADEILASVALY